MSEYQSTLSGGQIQFHQWCEPPLESGDYTVTIEQNVQELGRSYGDEFQFSVAGPRFALSPSEVYSVYPPKGDIGDFANTLPHVVFTRRTLPWERSVIPGQRAEGDRLPWMALLVFSAIDFKTDALPDGAFPDLELRPLGDLINPDADAAYVGPQVGNLAAYESKADLCNVLELPWELFQGVAPTLADLGYLAHVREVNTGDKETLSFLADGWFSVVLANRFPEPEVADTEPSLAVENRAYLVSLEGMQDYLPGGRAATGADLRQKNVRLAVLSSWSFHCQKAFTFKALMEKIDVRRLAVPWNSHVSANGSLSPTAIQQVHEAYALGYTALNHNTRLGEKSVSWYRGPLVPLDLPKETKYVFRPAADSALRYSPLDGMLDVTYAVAFQLGRLLALQDRHFSTALYAYRRDVQRQINRVLGQKRAQAVLGLAGGLSANGEENDLMQAYLRYHQGEGSGADAGWVATEFSLAPADNGNVPSAAAEPNQLRLTTDFDLTIPTTIAAWLARLLLLYRVPFVDLVPDERMLPPDSMRFFYLDPAWLKCLLEGACSVGRSSTQDELVDEYLRDNFLKLALDGSAKVRSRTPDQRVEADQSVPVSDLGEGGVDWPMLTGFLIRSQVVVGWQGLEMRAWADSGKNATQALTPLRIDRLAPDIMLCIFLGQVKRIEVKQPPEGMHFGASVDGTDYIRFHLRRLDTSGPGDQLDASTRSVVPLRQSSAQRVIDVSQLCVDLKTTLNEKSARDEKAEFTSADFAVEMVESPGRVIFDVSNPANGDAQ